MRTLNYALYALLLLTIVPECRADGEKDNSPEHVRRIPGPGIEVPDARKAELQNTLQSLSRQIAELQQTAPASLQSLLPDVMIFERAVRCALEHNEFFAPKDLDQAAELLQIGLQRASQLRNGRPEWPTQSGLVVRGFISRIDQTVQPYGLVVPETYDFSHSVPTRCDLWFHGRGETLSEVSFLWERLHSPGRYTPAHTIVLHPYGRYSNAFKFAGETDVLEALQDVRQRYQIDDQRISVRGFSMGGAACWQFAVHYPDRWFAANPGAGFAETPEFLKTFQNETLNPTWWERRLWNLYDCDKYARNLWHCPTIAYSGENDRQKQAADVMADAMQAHGMQLRHVIGAEMGHSIDDASKVTIEAAMDSLAKSADTAAALHLQFETYTLKYNRLHWLTIDGLQQHWSKAVVIAEPAAADDFDRADQPPLLTLQVQNVSAFTLDFPAGTFSGDRWPASRFGPFSVAVRPLPDEGNSTAAAVSLLSLSGPFSDGSANLQAHQQADGSWTTGPLQSELRKRHDLQGPIDDAFMDSFIFVRPTGTAANPAVQQWADAELDRAIEHWRRHFRGDARVVDDHQVTDEMIQSASLVLWGDPASNSVIGRIADRLPLNWTSDQLQVGERSFDAGSCAPILIYPNPLNPQRYVVLNSSFTFRDFAYLNNARQVPMLPDWAVVDLRTPPGNVWPGKIVLAGFFDENWQLQPLQE